MITTTNTTDLLMSSDPLRAQLLELLKPVRPGGAKELSPRGAQLLSHDQRAILLRGIYEPEPVVE